MSDTDNETAQYESKTEFIEAVRANGATLDGITYYTEGDGGATTYHARDEDGEEGQVPKSDVEAAWEERETAEDAEEDEDEGPEEVHLGTFYFSKANWDTDADREQLEEMLDDAGWYIDGEVDSGGYRIKTTR